MTDDGKSLMPGLGDFTPPTTAAEMRALIDGHVAHLNVDLPPVARFWEGVVFRAVGGVEVRADVILPKGQGPFPLMVFLHGGAWVCGSTATHRKLAHRFAEQGFLVVAVDFRLAPEHPYPASLDDCVEAIVWAHAHAAEYGGDAARFVVAGDSSGANLAAAAVGVLAARPGAPVPAILALIYGYYDYEAMYRRGLETPQARSRMADIITGSYFGTTTPAFETLRDPGVSPIHVAGRLPPTLLFVGSEDPFLEQHEAMAAALAAQGVEHLHLVIPALSHGALQQEADVPDAARHIREISEKLKARLRGATFAP